ncbi:MAG: imidazole glycerol phosphate synthase subunit HisH [Actinobacteria bacterium]|nr:imidazole glycerol phosphate synthase subunit HisH [Actinomycetota bacterium]
MRLSLILGCREFPRRREACDQKGHGLRLRFRQHPLASRPVLGICVGMQVMFSSGLEHGEETPGLGQWPGEVSKLKAETLPHIGWTAVEPDAGSELFKGIEGERFYFVHSYAAKKWELDVQAPFIPPKLTWAEHGERFLAAVENGPLSATQFHPEKSGQAGLQLLRNWTKTL